MLRTAETVCSGIGVLALLNGGGGVEAEQILQLSEEELAELRGGVDQFFVGNFWEVRQSLEKGSLYYQECGEDAPGGCRWVEGLSVTEGEYAVVLSDANGVGSEVITQDELVGHLENREDLYLPSRFSLYFGRGPVVTIDDTEIRGAPGFGNLPRVRLNYKHPHPEFGDPMAAAENLFLGDWLHSYAENSLQVQTVEAMTDNEAVRRNPLRGSSSEALNEAIDQYNEFYTDEQIEQAFKGDRTATRDFVIRSTDFERTRNEGIEVSEEITINLADIQQVVYKYRGRLSGSQWESFGLTENGATVVVEFEGETGILTFNIALNDMGTIAWGDASNTAMFPVGPIITWFGKAASPNMLYIGGSDLRGTIWLDTDRYNQHIWREKYMGAIYNENRNSPAEWNFLMADGPTHQ